MQYKLLSTIFIIIPAYLFLGCSQFQESSTIDDRVRDFDSDWRFIRDSVAGAEQPNYDDVQWRVIDLPHDWSIEDLREQIPGKTIGPFSKDSEGPLNGQSTGHVVGGTGWYRKTFILSPNDKNKLVSVCFEGAYMETDVWVNGNYVGAHKYGYTSFYFDITKYCKPAGEKNVIAVRVINKGKNSRWYSGSGIYRHVKLIVTNRLHIDQWGVYITAPQVSAEEATVKIVTSISNEKNEKSDIKIHTHLYGADGKFITESETSQSIDANSQSTIAQNILVKTPKLWSTDSPHLYKAEVSVLVNDNVVDVTTTSFGIRAISFSAENGFILNGKKMELRGGCMHHDNGILGAAAIDRAEERKIEMLKANGYNAVRCSHNPPSEKFLEACDSLGVLVIDEAFDHWQKPKNPDDYHRFFDDWSEKDFASMILRDRNHPSVILWSIGNEIEERYQPAGVAINKKLRAIANELDPSRKITEAVNDPWDNPGDTWDSTAPAFAGLDVGGYNYRWWEYENDHQKFPNRIMMGTESVAKEAAQNWNLVEKHYYIIGDFVWTAMDYLGESGIGHTSCSNEKGNQLKPWPWFNSYCGDIDLIGNKKPQSYYRDVVWRRSWIEMAVHTPLEKGCKESVSYWGWPDEVQSWTWPGNEGKMMQVYVYSRAEKVRLMLNGKMVGEKNPDSLLTAKFELAYDPGKLTAVAVQNGKEVGTVSLETTGLPKSIRLKADRQSINANRNDLSYITAEVVDDKGDLVPDANLPLEFTISGNGELAAVGNANPFDMASFKQPKRNTFRGRCLIILRPKGKAGAIVLEARSRELQGAKIAVQTKIHP